MVSAVFMVIACAGKRDKSGGSGSPVEELLPVESLAGDKKDGWAGCPRGGRYWISKISTDFLFHKMSVPEPTFIFPVGQPFDDQGDHLSAIPGYGIHQAPAF